MAEQTREQKLAEIDSINRKLTRGVKRVEEEDRKIESVDPKWLYRRRDELQAEVDGEAAQAVPSQRVRQIRMVGSKGL